MARTPMPRATDAVASRDAFFMNASEVRTGVIPVAICAAGPSETSGDRLGLCRQFPLRFWARPKPARARAGGRGRGTRSLPPEGAERTVGPAPVALGSAA